MLATDGTVRWTGAPVGKLVAGEEVLRPRIRLIADEHLTGAPRDAVEARLDRWVKSYVEKLLGPLFTLGTAADVSGIARGVAFQLIEALGVLDRQRVADEVKGLEQPERAILRKYGMRFGAYHIYLPLLLKPAPRALAVQLWALVAFRTGEQGRRGVAPARGQRAHVHSGQSRGRRSALPDRRLSALRRPCRSRGYSGTPC